MITPHTKKNAFETINKNHTLTEQVTIFSAIWPILRIAFPSIITFFVTRMADTFAYRFLGQLGNASYTAAAGTASVWLLMCIGS